MTAKASESDMNKLANIFCICLGIIFITGTIMYEENKKNPETIEECIVISKGIYGMSLVLEKKSNGLIFEKQVSMGTCSQATVGKPIKLMVSLKDTGEYTESVFLKICFSILLLSSFIFIIVGICYLVEYFYYE